MEKRDPKFEPQPGDRVGGRFVVRLWCDGSRVVYRVLLKSGFWGRIQDCGIGTWRRWAKDKEVLHVAD
jgi:hypothetical protein